MKLTAPLTGRLTSLSRGKAPLLGGLMVVNALITTLAAQTITHQTPAAMVSALTTPWFWWTVLLLALIAGTISFLTRLAWLGVDLVCFLSTFLVFCSYFKALITSIPLTIQDIFLVDQLGDITELNASSIHMSPLSIICICLLVAWMVVVTVLFRKVRLDWKPTLITGGACALVLALLFGPLGDWVIFRPLGVPVAEKMSQAAVNREAGVILGLWRGMLNSVVGTFSEGNQDPQKLEELANQAQELAATVSNPEVEEQPNVILILSESFFDVTGLPGVSFEEDPVADFHALQEEGVSGTFYTRTLGYGTCNIELEILTGINTGLLWGEDLYNLDPELFSRLPSVPSLLGDAGYYTGMVHMYDDSIYHRTPMFEALGFDETYFEEDFAAIDPKAEDGDYLEEQRNGSFYSDSYLSSLLIDLYEEKQGDSPLFLYGISMENHAPYDGEKYAPEERTVAVSSSLSGQAADMLQAVCQGANSASQALGELADYFRDQEEPTVIVFFGDHRPGLGLQDGGTVYSKLGMCSTDYSRWSQEEILELYSTDYLIWSNDPSYLPGQPGEEMDRGTNYLGVDLLNLTGVEKPIYWGLLDHLSRSRLNDTWVYSLGRDGTYSNLAPTTGPDGRTLTLLSALLDDALYGDQVVTEKISQTPG